MTFYYGEYTRPAQDNVWRLGQFPGHWSRPSINNIREQPPHHIINTTTASTSNSPKCLRLDVALLECASLISHPSGVTSAPLDSTVGQFCGRVYLRLSGQESSNCTKECAAPTQASCKQARGPSSDSCRSCAAPSCHAHLWKPGRRGDGGPRYLAQSHLPSFINRSMMWPQPTCRQEQSGHPVVMRKLNC